MTLPPSVHNYLMPVKYFLNAYRALSDGRMGVRHLEELIARDRLLVSEWKVSWIGCCAVLRTSIDLFQIDAKSCIDAGLRAAMKREWKEIKDNSDRHPLFWKFLKLERDNIIHQYRWAAYEAWLHDDGTLEPRLSLLTFDKGHRPIIAMRDGYFEGRNSVELLQEAADWVEARIFSAIRSAGFEPEEERRIRDFAERPKEESIVKGLLNIPESGPESEEKSGN